MEYKETEETGEADWRERGRMAWGGGGGADEGDGRDG